LELARHPRTCRPGSTWFASGVWATRRCRATISLPVPWRVDDAAPRTVCASHGPDKPGDEWAVRPPRAREAQHAFRATGDEMVTGLSGHDARAKSLHRERLVVTRCSPFHPAEWLDRRKRNVLGSRNAFCRAPARGSRFHDLDDDVWTTLRYRPRTAPGRRGESGEGKGQKV